MQTPGIGGNKNKLCAITVRNNVCSLDSPSRCDNIIIVGRHWIGFGRRMHKSVCVCRKSTINSLGNWGEWVKSPINLFRLAAPFPEMRFRPQNARTRRTFICAIQTRFVWWKLLPRLPLKGYILLSRHQLFQLCLAGWICIKRGTTTCRIGCVTHLPHLLAIFFRPQRERALSTISAPNLKAFRHANTTARSTLLKASRRGTSNALWPPPIFTFNFGRG